MPPKKGNNKKALSKKKKPVVLVETESDSSSVDEVDDETGEDGESKFYISYFWITFPCHFEKKSKSLGTRV